MGGAVPHRSGRAEAGSTAVPMHSDPAGGQEDARDRRCGQRRYHVMNGHCCGDLSARLPARGGAPVSMRTSMA